MLAFSFAMGMTAQTKVEGEVTLGAGYGETAPYLGDVNLKINSGKFTIMPFFNIKGITPYNSTELSDINLTYSDSRNKCSQEQELQSKGYHMEYGAGIQYLHNDHNIFKASFEGGYLNKSVSGYRTENLLNPNGGLMNGVKSFLNYPTLNSLEMKVQASYLHKTQREGEQLMLKYTYELEKEDEDKCQELTETEGFNDYSLSHITGDIDIHSHEVLFDWKRPLAQHHILNMGGRYNHRYIISDDAQYLDGREWYDEVFRHRMQTAAVFAGYTLKANALDADVRVEYDYTRMQDKNLHDVIPQARLAYHLDTQNTLVASYAMRVIRPTLPYLVDCHTVTPYTVDYGNPELEGIHVNRMALAYQLKTKKMDFTTTVAHINVTDGFNAIWFVKDNIRYSTWGNEGVRKAIEITPEVFWRASECTKLKGSFTALWDERIAYAINLRNPNWGFTGRAGLEQQLPLDIKLALNAMISKGNTVDVYSHEGLNYTFGGDLERSFLNDKLTATLGYEYKKLPVIEITQGAFTGSIYTRDHNPNTVKLALSYKF